MKKLPDGSGITGDDTHVSPDRGLPPRTPSWVKIFGIIALVLILLFITLHLTGNGFGGHTSHMQHGGQKP